MHAVTLEMYLYLNSTHSISGWLKSSGVKYKQHSNIILKPYIKKVFKNILESKDNDIIQKIHDLSICYLDVVNEFENDY
jgi:uncharacterized linocin/CFP29 family protein